jgi:hypothetical protein
MKRLILALALCAVAAPAHATTASEAAACYADAVRFCGVTQADKDAGAFRRLAIGLCMLAHRAQVAPRCEAVFKAHGL